MKKNNFAVLFTILLDLIQGIFAILFQVCNKGRKDKLIWHDIMGLSAHLCDIWSLRQTRILNKYAYRVKQKITGKKKKKEILHALKIT